MPWVRFDDTFPTNRKVDGLSDAAYRLHTSAIFWCARNLTDGVVTEEDLELVTARVRMPARFAAELVRRGLWHVATEQCESEHCTEPGPDGWVIHDYLEFQPSKEKVLVERKKSADRQKKWRDSHSESSSNGSSNAVSNGRTNAAPSRPVPEEPKTLLSADADETFEDFWRAYPPRRNNSKHKARLAYDAALKRGVDPAEIQTAVETYADDRKGEDQKFTKHAVTWLHARPWDDPDPIDEPERALFPWER